MESVQEPLEGWCIIDSDGDDGVKGRKEVTEMTMLRHLPRVLGKGYN